MLKVLLKKQVAEVFKSYFYDAKKNRMRSKLAIAGWIIFFIVVMVGVLGGIFTGLSLSLCGSLTQIGMGWMYFLLMGIIAIVLGAFGSVFNTYAGLYLSKDNDLLLSMPIPVRTIIASRLMNVYLMGAMYSIVVMVPALIVYWAVAGVTASRVICGILFLLIITAVVLLLSCLLGWVVARISLKLKNRSFTTVILSLLFIGAYYFFYFKANDFIRDIILNAEVYGERIKGASYALYLFGRIGEGSWAAAAAYIVVTGLLCALVWTAIVRSFLKIATASGSTAKVRYKEKAVRQKTAFGALLGKEFARFTSSSNYMLNCGLGIILVPAFGVLLLFKGREICEALNEVLSTRPDSAAVLLCTAFCLMAAMNDMAAPSVSLEGKSLWIPQSMPVSPRLVLRAKASVQFILTAVPVLFACFCGAVILNASAVVKVLFCLMPLSYTVFSAIFNTCIGLRMPLLNWTNEIAPIKQSGAVTIALFGGWAVCVLFAGLYMLIGYKAGAAVYLLFWTVLFAAAGSLMMLWLERKGANEFVSL